MCDHDFKNYVNILLLKEGIYKTFRSSFNSDHLASSWPRQHCYEFGIVLSSPLKHHADTDRCHGTYCSLTSESAKWSDKAVVLRVSYLLCVSVPHL
jgi:hypothetical protein